MSTASAVEPRRNAQIARAAWRTRLGSILAIVPLGVWVVNHLYENLLSWRGAARWEGEVTGASSPFAEFLITTVVILPLILHTIWGLARMRKTRPNLGAWFTFDNLRFLLQRLSALGVLFFIPAHLFLARIQPALNSPRGHITLAEFSEHMKTAPTFTVYLLGTLGVAYHLANGVWGFVIHQGWYQGPKAQRRLRTFTIVFFLVLLWMAWGSIFGVRMAT